MATTRKHCAKCDYKGVIYGDNGLCMDCYEKELFNPEKNHKMIQRRKALNSNDRNAFEFDPKPKQ